MNEPQQMPLSTAALDEYQTLSADAGYIDFSDRSRIEISGSDRSNFLHSFCTNDINALTPGTGCEAFLCNPKGKTVGHVTVFCHSDRLVVDTAANQATSLIEHLSRYVIMEDVQLEDCSATQPRVFICGAQSHEILKRIVGRDTAAINFNKGCYLGQETVARVDAVGHVNRRLVQIDCNSLSPLSAQATLTHDGRAVGAVTSSGYSPKHKGAIALGYVQQTLANPGQALTVESRTAVIIEAANS